MISTCRPLRRRWWPRGGDRAPIPNRTGKQGGNGSNLGGGVHVQGANAASFLPPTGTAGTVYYYVVVTNTRNGTTAAATSNAALP